MAGNQELERQLTPPEVAEILRITKNTVYELVKRGELRASKAGKKILVDTAEVQRYLTASRDPARSGSGESSVRSGTGENRPAARNERPEGFVLCGQDLLLDILARRLEERMPGERVYRSHLGSYNGLFELYQGRVHAATAHLWDGETGDYNLPYLHHMLPGMSLRVLHVAQRMVGFYVPKGNPAGFVSWDSLKKKDFRLANRERGSGMRVLLDERLRLAGLRGAGISGYDSEYPTHLAVASAVARREADLALGNQKVARQVAGIDFVPLQKEKYDMIFPEEALDKPLFRALADIVASQDFKNELNGLGDYDTGETGRFR